MNRREWLASARRVVVKIGSRILRENPVLRTAAIADEVARLRRERRVDVVVVTSGAIALGMDALGLSARPTEIPRLQAAAAVGQGRLMQHWDRAFGAHGIAVGQVLLTHDDVADRGRYLNARHALFELLEYGAVPVINENDTVAVEEIKFGDNDRLAALTCNLVGADALILLTDVDGILDASGRRIADGWSNVPASFERPGDGVGTGGMASKVEAARIAGRSGVAVVVAPGMREGVVRAVLAGEDVGTFLEPDGDRLSSRKHWLAFASRPEGALCVDAGARAALAQGGKSLLPSGIRDVRGAFAIGDPVSIEDESGREFARGLAGYSSAEVARIRGRKSAEIETILGYKYLDEVVHRDDLVVLS